MPRNGTPATTAASYSRGVDDRVAASRSSTPCAASSDLFAVTTGIPRCSASSTRVRAGSIPPRSSTRTSGGVAKNAPGSTTRLAAGGSVGRGRRESRMRACVIPRGGCELLRANAAKALPTLPQPRSPTRTGAALVTNVDGALVVSRATTDVIRSCGDVDPRQRPGQPEMSAKNTRK